MTDISTLAIDDYALAAPLASGGAEAAARHAAHQLSGDMGTLQLVFAVLSYNAPLGVLAIVVALVIGYGIGIGAPLLFMTLGLVMGLFAVGYTAMSRYLPNPGAFYSYITVGLGRPLGLGSSFVAMVSYTVAMVGILIFTSMAIEALLHTTMGGPDIAWWAWALLFVAMVGVLGYLKVDVSARVLSVLLGLELLIVAIWDAAVLSSRVTAGELTFSSFDPHVAMAGSVATGLIFAVSCFSGFEATAIFRDEVRDPEKTIPRATYLAIAMLTIFYTVGSWAFIQALGEADAVRTIAAHPSTAFFDMVARYLGTVGYHSVTVLIISGGFAGLMAYHNVLSRYLFSLGVDGILPRGIGIPHPRLKSPHRPSLLVSGFTTLSVLGVAICGVPPEALYVQLVGIAGYSFIALFVLAAIGIATYLVRSRPSDFTLWERIVAPVGAAGFLFAIGVVATANIDLLTGSTALSILALGITFGSLLAGVLLALVFRRFKPDVFVRIGRQ